MKKLSSVALGLISVIGLVYAAPQEVPQGESPSNIQAAHDESVIVYQEPTTGVEIIFASDGKNWEKIIASGESELLFGDRKDVRKATSKATLRAKANIAKFMKEKLSTTETLEEITKTISNSSSKGGEATTTGSERKTVETVIESIRNSSEAILKGILILEQQINQKEKVVKIKVGVSRKTMKAADSLSSEMNKDLSKPQAEALQKYNDGENEIRRSKNYNNF